MAAPVEPLPLDERSTNMTDHEIKRYRHTRFYIIDDKDPTAEIDNEILGVNAITAHDQKIRYARAIPSELFADVEIVRVFFNQQATAETFFDYWDEQLAQCTEEDMLIIYYHGLAGCEDLKYSWIFENPPNEEKINAYKFIKKVHDSRADALFILDCYIQTRFSRKWRHPSNSGNSSTTEIIASPGVLQDCDGGVLKHRRDFTEALAADLDLYRKRVMNDESPSKAFRSIPQILATDPLMYSNPIRIWLSKSQRGRRVRKDVRRFKLDPQLIRLTGKMEFFAQVIQAAEPM